MKRMLIPVAVIATAMIGASCANPASRNHATERHPRSEDTYTITSVIQVVQPVNPADMKDDFQDVRVLAQDNDSCTVEVTYYPLNRPAIGENPNWRKDDAGMTEYLKPTATENWDQAMRRDLIAELHQAGIEPDQLTDKQLVEQVSAWAMKRAHSTSAFSIWAVQYPEGKPAVYPPLREAFDHEKPDPTWTDEQMFDQEALGRSMFYHRVHGACTSSAVYLTTIFRALGIPTRIIFCIPPFDPNDDTQARKFYDNIHYHQAREAVRSALDGTAGFEDHMFNEVYVDHHWVRLNYKTLGQPILDAHYFGLLTHIYTCADLSQVPLAQTWGMRFFKYPAGQPKLSSVNPYRLISVQDHFGTDAHVDNPPVAPAELRTVTIAGLYEKGSSAIPKWVAADKLEKSGTDFLIAGREWISGGAYHQMSAFEKKAGREFLLVAPEHPAVKARLNGLTLSSGDGSFQAYAARVIPEDKAKLVPGIAYNLKPENTNEIYRWIVGPELAPLTFKAISEESRSDHGDSGKTRSPAPGAYSTSGPNQVLFEYLENPVEPPANMDARYTKEGLINAIQLAARNAGITVKKVIVDDSEFPFLMGVICAGSDAAKLKAEIKKMDGYGYSGSIGSDRNSDGSDTCNVFCIVPYSAYPPGTEHQIGHRLMLREQVFYDKINGRE